MGKLSATMTIGISYSKKMPITIRRFPTDFEINELEKYRHKLVDEDANINDNEITVKIYNKRKKSFTKTISGGNFDFNQINPAGTFIEIRIKYPEKQIVHTVKNIVRELCNKHLEPCVMFPSRLSISCTINNFQPNKQCIQNFLLDFTDKINKNVKLFKVTKEESVIDYSDSDICDRCKKAFHVNEMYDYTAKNGELFRYCPTCYEIKQNIENRKTKDKNSKMSLKKKITLGSLIIIVCFSIILATASILGFI